MGKKRIRCFKYEIIKNKVGCDQKYLKNIFYSIFDDKNKDINTLQNGNKVLKFENQNDGNYFSLELLSRVNGVVVQNNYLFLRIGRQKEIDGALKRNLQTFESEEIIEKDQQDSYELEICTYLLIDSSNGVILELVGQYAPSVKAFNYIINFNLNKIHKFKDLSIEYNNILTEKMIDTFKNEGVRLGKMGYNYTIPDVEALKQLGLDIEQIKALNELGVFEVEVTLKNKPRIPLTKSSEKIKYAVSAFSNCAKDIKDTIFFRGSTSNSGSRDYTFKEEEVTYFIDVNGYKRQGTLYIKLSLDQLAEQAYNKLKDLYESNKNDIEKYIE